MYLTTCPFFFACCVILPLETLPPGDPSGGVVYLRIVLSPEKASRPCEYYLTWVFTGRYCQHLAQPPSWRTTPCRLSATAYSLYSQLPSISEAVLPSATWGRAMPWWQGPTYHTDLLITSCNYTNNPHVKEIKHLNKKHSFIHLKL